MGGKKRVCVIGSGVVGLTAAVKLLEDCHTDVEVPLDITDLAYDGHNIHIKTRNVSADDDDGGGWHMMRKMNLQSSEDAVAG